MKVIHRRGTFLHDSSSETYNAVHASAGRHWQRHHRMDGGRLGRAVLRRSAGQCHFSCRASSVPGGDGALVPLFLTPSLGTVASIAVLGSTAVVVLPLIFLFPPELPYATAESSMVSGIRRSSVLGLIASFLVMAGIVGVWVYVEPIALTAGLSVCPPC
jgi:hypothetical protein